MVSLLAGCASSNLPPAEPSPQEMDRADRVIIVPASTDSLYARLGDYLKKEGFNIINSDPEEKDIQTGFTQFTRGIMGYTIKLNTTISDSTVHFFGRVKSGRGSSEIENRGMWGSPIKVSWEKLQELATGFPNRAVYYSRN